MKVSAEDVRFQICCAMGDILMKLHTDCAPITCENFCAYVRGGLLANARFFRILGSKNQVSTPYPIAVVQGGLPYDPALGYQPARGLGPIVHETTAMTGLRHLEGTVSMARFGPGETYGSFFICVGEQRELDAGGHRFPDGLGAAAFGHILDGWNVIQALSEAAETTEFLAHPIAITSIHRVE